jgi:hypothetical protein
MTAMLASVACCICDAVHCKYKMISFRRRRKLTLVILRTGNIKKLIPN